ncbi:unnamed protein product [Thelazia callipaeda]|uniref:Transposase n=1 Tax=Thelazia callipaeda TaxID=103827 RepID=A0A0N5CWP2_THECL|nr:unnamed protein product [Thelazia callipaeda]
MSFELVFRNGNAQLDGIDSALFVSINMKFAAWHILHELVDAESTRRKHLFAPNCGHKTKVDQFTGVQERTSLSCQCAVINLWPSRKTNIKEEIVRGLLIRLI